MNEEPLISKNRTTPAWVWVRRLLLVVACIQGSAFMAVASPKQLLEASAQWLGVAPLGESPLAGYLARQASALYVLHACTVAMVAFSLPACLDQVRALGWITLGFSCMMLWIDVREGMPAYWTCLETMSIFTGAWLLLGAHRWARNRMHLGSPEKLES